MGAADTPALPRLYARSVQLSHGNMDEKTRRPGDDHQRQVRRPDWNSGEHVHQRTVDYPDDLSNGFHVMLDIGVLVTVRWEQVERLN